MRRLTLVLVAVLLALTAARPADAAWQDSVQASTSSTAGTLAAPTGLNCAGSSLPNATLSWDLVPGATEYEVTGPLGLDVPILKQVLSIVNGVASFSLGLPALGTYTVKAKLTGTSWESAPTSMTMVNRLGIGLSCGP